MNHWLQPYVRLTDGELWQIIQPYAIHCMCMHMYVYASGGLFYTVSHFGLF